jgi:hypothetical protein
LLRDSNGDKFLRLTADERRQLDALRRNLDPEALKRIDFPTDAE